MTAARHAGQQAPKDEKGAGRIGSGPHQARCGMGCAPRSGADQARAARRAVYAR